MTLYVKLLQYVFDVWKRKFIRIGTIFNTHDTSLQYQFTSPGSTVGFHFFVNGFHMPLNHNHRSSMSQHMEWKNNALHEEM